MVDCQVNAIVQNAVFSLESESCLNPMYFLSTLGCPGPHGALLHHLSPGLSGVCDGNEVHPLCPGLVDQVSTGSKWVHLFSLRWHALPGDCVLDHQWCHHGLLWPLPPQWNEVRDRPGRISGFRVGLPQPGRRTGAVLEQQRWQVTKPSPCTEESPIFTSSCLQPHLSTCSTLQTPTGHEGQSRPITVLCL